jgi:hypothetical protein
MMAHSPEPWTVVDAELMRGVPGKAIVSARGDVVAFVYHTFADVQADNAMLLCVAPGLLAALKMLLDAAYDTCATGVPCVSLDSAIEAAKTVIAKVQGAAT